MYLSHRILLADFCVLIFFTEVFLCVQKAAGHPGKHKRKKLFGDFLRLPTCVILLEAHTWLSFNITIPLRSCLCMDTPPTSMAYFSGKRKPGVVLRVPATSPCHPLAVATAWSWEQRVAIPETRDKQLRAGLSPRRRHLAGPLTTAVSVTASGPVETRSQYWRIDIKWSLAKLSVLLLLLFYFTNGFHSIPFNTYIRSIWSDRHQHS